MVTRTLKIQLWAAQSKFLVVRPKLSKAGKGYELAVEDWKCFLEGL